MKLSKKIGRMTRKDFIRRTIKAGALTTLSFSALSACFYSNGDRADKDKFSFFDEIPFGGNSNNNVNEKFMASIIAFIYLYIIIFFIWIKWI